MCKKQFSESQNEWFVEKKLEAMPWHCDSCRQVRYKQRKEKATAEAAASPAAIVVSQAPVVAPPVPAVPSIGLPVAQSPAQPVQVPNALEASWNEIVEFGDSEEFW